MSKKLIALIVLCCLSFIGLAVVSVLMFVLERYVYWEPGKIFAGGPPCNLTTWGRVSPYLFVLTFFTFVSSLIATLTFWLSERKRNKEAKKNENLI